MKTVEQQAETHGSHEAGLLNTIIIGASAAGLACAASLDRKNIPYLLLEKNDQVAGSWRAHYDRLHLNTEKWNSHLPYLPFPSSSGVFLPRDEVIKYMENYASRLRTKPLFNQTVQAVTHQPDGSWQVRTADHAWQARNIIIATGNNRRPVLPRWPGMDGYKGKLIHSSVYKNGKEYEGKKVLVVGFGSSACEIAICLHEYGAYPSMSVKGAVNVVPRGNGAPVTGRLLHQFAFISRRFPELVDKLVTPHLRKKYRFLSSFGLEPLPYGPNVQMVRHNKVPVLDIGTMSLIRQGIIKIYPGIDAFTNTGIKFIDGRTAHFDAVVLATGFHPQVSELITDYKKVTDPNGRPLVSGRESALPGLFFCGFSVSPHGMLNQIGREAMMIAKLISRQKNKVSK